MRNAKLSAKVDRLGGSKISDVDLTIYDGVDDVSSRNGHARGMVVGCRDGGSQRCSVGVLTRDDGCSERSKKGGRAYCDTDTGYRL